MFSELSHAFIYKAVYWTELQQLTGLSGSLFSWSLFVAFRQITGGTVGMMCAGVTVCKCCGCASFQHCKTLSVWERICQPQEISAISDQTLQSWRHWIFLCISHVDTQSDESWVWQHWEGRILSVILENCFRQDEETNQTLPSTLWVDDFLETV